MYTYSMQEREKKPSSYIFLVNGFWSRFQSQEWIEEHDGFLVSAFF